MTSIKPSLEKFLAKQDDQLAALRVSSSVELDFSYESIDRVESALASVMVPGPASKQLGMIEDQLVRYLGETLIDHAGGSWAFSDHPSGPRPAIRVPGVAKRMFEPLAAVRDFRRLRRAGLLRDYTECWDLALRRAQLARLRLAQAEELASLENDVADLVNKRVSLDASESALAVVEAALVAVTNVTAERQRTLRTRVEVLLGVAFIKTTRAAEWTVVEKPEYSDFGQFEFGGWSPHGTVVAASRGPADGLLHRNLLLAIDEHS